MIIRVPATKEGSDACAAKARENGCEPIWWEPYGAWCCGCPGGDHAADQQCSIINQESARRRRRP